MFQWTLGSLLSIGLVASFSPWSSDWVYLQAPLQIFAFGILLVLIIGATAISMSKIWHKGQEIFDDWDGVVEKVNEIYDKLIGEDEEALAASSSPTGLTERGRDIAKRIKAEALVEKYKNAFVAANIENAYDIQQKARNWAGDELPKIMDAEDLSKLKEVAFDSGLSMSLIARVVIGLVLRDAVLREKGIPLARLDDDRSV